MNVRFEPVSIRKAAVLIASLDAETADTLLRQLEPGLAAELRRARATLGAINPDERECVLSEFFAAQANAVDARAEAAVSSWNTSPDEPPFTCLQVPDAGQLARLLEGEHPRTIAVVISHLEADRGVQVIAQLSGELQTDVLRRLAELDEMHPDVIREIEQGLQSRMMSAPPDCCTTGLAAVSDILAAADADTGRLIRRNLAQFDSELARSLPSTPFEFADLSLTDDATLWTVMSAAESDWIVLALAGAEPNLAERIAGMLPPDEADDFRQALDELGPTRLSDVEEAQQRIADLARQLERQGHLHLVPWRLGSVEV